MNNGVSPCCRSNARFLSAWRRFQPCSTKENDYMLHPIRKWHKDRGETAGIKLTDAGALQTGGFARSNCRACPSPLEPRCCASSVSPRYTGTPRATRYGESTVTNSDYIESSIKRSPYEINSMFIMQFKLILNHVT